MPVPPLDDYSRSEVPEQSRDHWSAHDEWGRQKFAIQFSVSSPPTPIGTAAPEKPRRRPQEVVLYADDIIKETNNAAAKADSSYNPREVRFHEFEGNFGELKVGVGPDGVVLGGFHDIIVSFGGPAAIGAFIKYGIDKLIEWRKASGNRELKIKVGEIEISAKNRRDLRSAVKAASTLRVPPPQ